MNYIPGFSNYLQTAIPRYAVGGRVMGGERMMYDGDPTQGDEYSMSGGEVVVPAVQPMVQPMTQEVVAPYDLSGLDLSGLDSLYGMNFGSNFGGGPMGGVYEADPNLQYIAAPLSNKGNATSQTGGNTFAVRVDQPVRLVDHRTNQVVFEGTGFDAARKATELGQGLTDQFGRKANYSIQTADPSGNYSTVAYEKKNKSTLGQIANVVGTALPLAAMAIPGLQGLAAVAAGAGLGGAGAALKGDNILKGAVLGGLTSAGGALLAKPLGAAANLTAGTARAVGTGIGATAGGLATGQNLKNALIGGVLSGGLSYVAPDIQRGLGIGQGANVNTSTGGGGSFDGINVVGSNLVSPSVTLGGSPNKIQKALGQGAKEPYDGLNVVGNKFGVVSGIGVGGDTYGAPTEGRSPLDRLTDTADPNDIVVDATKAVVTPAVSVDGGALPTTTTPDVLPNDIVVDATKPVITPAVSVDGGFTLEPEVLSELDELSEAEKEAKKKKLGLEDYLRLAGLASGVIGGAAGGGTGQTGTYTRGGGSLNPIFSAKLPSAGGLGAIGATRTPRPMGDQDWLTYGTRPELNFFDYSSPTGPAPITTPIPNEPRGPSMYVPDTTRFAKGGRAEFAVSGPGTGRSDDIPAVLSDGEYVIDAETVALLGDGSSKAGAKKLDELRVKVRKHKGQKLAKGRFSANAKKPEAYLSGGLTR